MSKYVPDLSSRRWVIIAQQRLGRPNDGDGKKRDCPFCPGQEKETPPEVLRIGKSEPNQPGWQIRVIPNKFPITDFHEVIIHTPDCHRDLESLSLFQVNLIFKIYRDRYNFYKKRGQVLIFCNHRQNAGASLKHSHSQIVVLPFQINLDTLVREPLKNIVKENKYFYVWCPDFSQWPYEVWLSPKKEGGVFGDLTDEEITDLVSIFQKILSRLEHIHKKHRVTELPFAYNFYIYPKENWYLRIIPRFVYRAGFELGTGLSVNVVDPIDASLELAGLEKKIV